MAMNLGISSYCLSRKLYTNEMTPVRYYGLGQRARLHAF